MVPLDQLCRSPEGGQLESLDVDLDDIDRRVTGTLQDPVEAPAWHDEGAPDGLLDAGVEGDDAAVAAVCLQCPEAVAVARRHGSHGDVGETVLLGAALQEPGVERVRLYGNHPTRRPDDGRGQKAVPAVVGTY